MGARRNARVRPWLLPFLMALLAAARPVAHDLERTTVHLQVAADGAFTLRLAHDPSWLLLRMETFAGGNSVSPSDPEARDARLRALAPQAIDRVVLFVDGHEVRAQSAEYTPPPATVPVGEFALAAYTLRGQLPVLPRELRWYYGLVVDPYPFTVELSDGTSTTEQVLGDAWSTAIALSPPARRPLLTRLRDYVARGGVHVLRDDLAHILFVAGLLLLTPSARPALAQIASFTFAHSLALGLSLLGVVAVSPRLVEPLIALSIVYVAVENLVARTLTRARVVLVGLFGLAHGIDLSSALASMRISGGDFGVALFGFNLGVELGLMVAIVALGSLVRYSRQRVWYRARVAVPTSIVLASVGAYWTVAHLVGTNF